MFCVKREKTVCFSGHRPEKLPVNHSQIKILKSRLFLEIQEAINAGYTDFIVGCARGVDMWAALIIMELKNSYPSIKLHCAVPFKGHTSGWSGAERYDLSAVLNSADSVTYVSSERSAQGYSKRNRYMVDNSSLLIAVVTNMRSGTGSTVKYAEKCGIKVRRIEFEKPLGV